MDYTKEDMENFLGEDLTDMEFAMLRFYYPKFALEDCYKADYFTRLDTYRNAPGYFIFEQMLRSLPHDYWDMKHGIWTDGEEILCVLEDQADAIADLLTALGVDTNTGFYDPDEDKRNGETAENTGFYYVNCD